MILGYKTKWPDGTPTNFLEKILASIPATELNDQYIPKIHTFRKGNRWKEGMKITHATGVRTKKYYPFLTQDCEGVQEAEVCLMPDGFLSIWIIDEHNGDDLYYGRQLTTAQTLLFAANDGFNSVEEMIKWFFPKGPKQDPLEAVEDRIVGQIVHFTDFKY